MKILSLNINDFGGTKYHLMDYKKISYQGKEVIDWYTWKSIDKSNPCNEILSYVIDKEPSICIFQEYELNNSIEPKEFIYKMSEIGYTIIGNIPNYNISMTVMFVSNQLNYISIETDKHRDGRHYAVKTGEFIICGIHVPPKYDYKYWDNLINFYNKYKNEKIMLIGDFNTYIEGTDSRKKFSEILKKGAIDTWLKLGNSNDTYTEKKYKGRLDYAIISPNMYKEIDSMEIDQDIINKNVSDHAALIINLK